MIFTSTIVKFRVCSVVRCRHAHAHQTLHSSAATEVFLNRWCVSVCCEVLGMHMHVWPLLTNWYWSQTSGWDTVDHHPILPYKYMSSHKQAQGNFIIVRIYIPTVWSCREKLRQPADGTVSLLFFVMWAWACVWCEYTWVLQCCYQGSP